MSLSIRKVTIKGENKDKNIILIANQKGGVGKSTLASNLAAFIAVSGRRVCLVDADRQETAARWAQDRSVNENLAKITIIKCHDDIAPTLTTMSESFDYVIVDVAGRDSPEMHSALSIVDKLIIPCRPSQADIDTLPTMEKAINQAKYNSNNIDLKSYVLFNLCPTNNRSSELNEAKLLVESDYSFPIVGSQLSDRRVYRDAMSEGKGVVEMNDPKALIECNVVFKWILKAE